MGENSLNFELAILALVIAIMALASVAYIAYNPIAKKVCLNYAQEEVVVIGCCNAHNSCVEEGTVIAYGYVQINVTHEYCVNKANNFYEKIVAKNISTGTCASWGLVPA